MDPNERKQQSLKRLDQLYTGTPIAMPEAKEEKKKTPCLGLIGNTIGLAIGTGITLQYIAPTISEYASHMEGSTGETVKTLVGIIPLILAIGVILSIFSWTGGPKEEKEDEINSGG